MSTWTRSKILKAITSGTCKAKIDRLRRAGIIDDDHQLCEKYRSNQKEITMRFARLFERENQQILALIDYDDDDDITSVTLTTEHAGVRTMVSFNYEGETQTEDAQKALESLTEERVFNTLGKVGRSGV